MDIMSVLGIIASIFLLVFGMSSSLTNIAALGNFFDPASIALTVGGTFGALMITFPLKFFAMLPKQLVKVFMPKKYNPQTYISEIVQIAYDVRKNGILSVEDKIPSYNEEFMRKGMQLAVDGTDPENIRDILETELGFMIDRHKKGTAFFEKGAALAPGFGMIGTLVGLINMLRAMDAGGTDDLMVNMGIALVTTFYGSVMANVIFIPIANKLQERSGEEVLCRQIIIEGIITIVNGDNPKQIQEKLVSYIPPALRDLDKPTAKSSPADTPEDE